MTDLLSDPSETSDQIDDEYKDLDPVIAKRLRDKDAHIRTLEAEHAEYRNELRARASLEEITERIARQVNQDPTPDPDEVAAPPDKPQTVNLSEQVLKILEEEKAKDNRERNLERSRSGLRERFGADYNAYLKKAAGVLGVNENFLANLASSSPDGLLKLIDTLPLKDNGDLGTPPVSSVDTAKPFNQQTRKNAAYYSDLRKKDRQKYFSAAVQAEMHSEAMKQGAKFYEP